MLPWIAAFLFSLLFGDLMPWLLMDVFPPPDAAEIRTPAERATEAMLILHPA